MPLPNTKSLVTIVLYKVDMEQGGSAMSNKAIQKRIVQSEIGDIR